MVLVARCLKFLFRVDLVVCFPFMWKLEAASIGCFYYSSAHVWQSSDGQLVDWILLILFFVKLFGSM